MREGIGLRFFFCLEEMFLVFLLWVVISVWRCGEWDRYCLGALDKGIGSL